MNSSINYIIFGKDNCPYCDKAKDALKDKGYLYIDLLKTDSKIIDKLREHYSVEEEYNGKKKLTVPKIFKLEYIGGFEDL